MILLPEVAELEASLTTKQTPQERVDLLATLAWHYCRYKTLQDSEKLLKEAEALMTDLVYPKGAYAINIVKARHYYDRDVYDLALQFSTEGADFFREQGDRSWQLWALSIRAATLRILDEHVQAFEASKEQYWLAKELDDPQEITVALNSLGRNAQIRNDLEEALRHYKEAYELADSINDHYIHAITLANYASILRHMGRYDDAIKAAEKSLKILQDHDYVRDQAIPMGRLGDAYKAKGDYGNAEAWYKTRIQIMEQGERPAYKMTARVNLVSLHMLMDRVDDALPVLHEAVIFYAEKGNKMGESKCHQYLADAYEQIGDYQKALHHHRQFHDLKEAIFTEESDRRIKNIQILFDIERKQKAIDIEHEKMKMEKLHYERISRMRDEYIDSAAHDLKNPLASIFLTLHLLGRHLEAGNTAYITEAMRKIDVNATQMQDLIANLLDLARMEIGHNITLHHVPLKTLMCPIPDRFASKLEVSGLSFSLEMPAEPIIVSMDLPQLQRVFDNLVSNAIKFSPPGSSITICVKPEAANVIITIADTGFGIAPGDLPHIFERFFRAENSEQHQIEGTGLGLAIAKTIIKQHGGEITVISEPNVGTTFTVQLPRVK